MPANDRNNYPFLTRRVYVYRELVRRTLPEIQPSHLIKSAADVLPSSRPRSTTSIMLSSPTKASNGSSPDFCGPKSVKDFLACIVVEADTALLHPRKQRSTSVPAVFLIAFTSTPTSR